MRNAQINILSASDTINLTGSAYDVGQVVSASFHAYYDDATIAGTLKLQASNQTSYRREIYTPTEWVDIPNATVNTTAGSSGLITISSMAYSYIRAVFTVTSTGVQTIAVVADVSGSLNNKYFFINTASNAIAYYVWFNVDSGGVDPAIPGKTGVQVNISANDSAATVGTALQVALDALAGFVATGTTTVTVTNASAGGFTPASDNNTGFTFSVTTGGNSNINVIMNSLSV